MFPWRNKKNIRAHLFKANDAISKRYVKIHIEWYTNMLKFFCSAKATHIFSAKKIRIFHIESAKTVKEMTLNKLVKLTNFEQLGPVLFGWKKHLKLI